MKVSEIFEIVENIERLHNNLGVSADDYHPTDVEMSNIRDLLWDYRQELLKKEVK